MALRQLSNPSEIDLINLEDIVPVKSFRISLNLQSMVCVENSKDSITLIGYGKDQDSIVEFKVPRLRIKIEGSALSVGLLDLYFHSTLSSYQEGCAKYQHNKGKLEEALGRMYSFPKKASESTNTTASA